MTNRMEFYYVVREKRQMMEKSWEIYKEHVVEVKESLVDNPIATPRSCEQSWLPRPFDAWGESVATLLDCGGLFWIAGLWWTVLV